MSMWPSRTNLWGRKTRPVNLGHHGKTNGHDNYGDEKDEIERDEYKEYDEIVHENKLLLSRVEFLKSMLDHKEKELVGVHIQLRESREFMQTVVLELIQMKNYRPPAASTETRPSTALTEYIKKKNENSTGKLP